MSPHFPRIPVPTTRALTAVWTAVIVVLLVGGIVLTVVVLDIAQSRQAATEERDDLRSSLTQTQGALDDESAKSAALAEQVESLGEKPVVEPGGPQASPGIAIPGARGPGPTFAQTLRAVQASIGAGLNEVCDGSCEGDDGADSTVPGPPGSDSTVPGPTGSGGAKGDTGSTGSKGETGSSGRDGSDGRGVTRFDCIDGSIVVTYTDGTTQTIPGLTCVPPVVEPTPAP